MKNDFLNLFMVTKPVITVLHGMKGTDDQVLEKTRREMEIFQEAGVDGVIVENYFCTAKQAELVLNYVAKYHASMRYGINLLGDDQKNFELAEAYNCDFMQIDSVCGHLPLEEDHSFADFIQTCRANTHAKVIGGVRFKYQPYRSGRSLEEDLIIGLSRCDCLAVTGEGTGLETDTKKILNFRNVIGNFPLLVAAGVTLDNLNEQLDLVDGCIVGSCFKENGDVERPVMQQNVNRFMEAVKEKRKKDGEI